jgi:hypothetical protein
VAYGQGNASLGVASFVVASWVDRRHSSGSQFDFVGDIEDIGDIGDIGAEAAVVH